MEQEIAEAKAKLRLSYNVTAIMRGFSLSTYGAVIVFAKCENQLNLIVLHLSRWYEST